MRSQGEDPEFWFAKHIEKDHPVTLADHCAWLRKTGVVRVACHWRLYNFAITTAERREGPFRASLPVDGWRLGFTDKYA